MTTILEAALAAGAKKLMAEREAAFAARVASLPLPADETADKARRADVARLLPLELWRNFDVQPGDLSLRGRERMVEFLRACLNEERARGLAGRWTYNPAKHHQLGVLYQLEALELGRARRREAAHAAAV